MKLVLVISIIVCLLLVSCSSNESRGYYDDTNSPSLSLCELTKTVETEFLTNKIYRCTINKTSVEAYITTYKNHETLLKSYTPSKGGAYVSRDKLTLELKPGLVPENKFFTKTEDYKSNLCDNSSMEMFTASGVYILDDVPNNRKAGHVFASSEFRYVEDNLKIWIITKFSEPEGSVDLLNAFDVWNSFNISKNPACTFN